MDLARDADATRRSEALEARGDIDAVAIDVLALDDHVTEVDADPKGDPLAFGRLDIAVDHGALDLDRALHGIGHAAKLDQGAIAHQFDHAAAARGDRGLDQLAAMRLKPRERAALVLAHQARVADHIGGEDGGKSALQGQGAGALRSLAHHALSLSAPL